MMIRKRFLPLLLVLCLCLSLFPSAAFALDDAPLTDPEQQGEPTEPVAPDPENPKHPDAPAADPDAPGVQCMVRFVCQPEETVVTVFDAQEEPVPANARIRKRLKDQSFSDGGLLKREVGLAPSRSPAALSLFVSARFWTGCGAIRGWLPTSPPFIHPFITKTLPQQRQGLCVLMRDGSAHFFVCLTGRRTMAVRGGR